MISYAVFHLLCSVIAIFCVARIFKEITLLDLIMSVLLGPIIVFATALTTLAEFLENRPRRKPIVLWRKK